MYLNLFYFARLPYTSFAQKGLKQYQVMNFNKYNNIDPDFHTQHFHN